MRNFPVITWPGVLLLIIFGVQTPTLAEGYIKPTPIDTSSLPQLGDEMHEVNPFRGLDKAIELGPKAYLYNCSGCHGLEAVSGGMAPDLRELPPGPDDDEWYITRVRNGYVQNGMRKMPAYQGTLSQEGMWAIRSWLETLPPDN